MCIRDRDEAGLFFNERLEIESEKRKSYTESRRQSRLKSDEDNVKIYLIKDLDTSLIKIGSSCLLYTSDAADERSSVDLGGRRIIKKKKKKKQEYP